MKSMMRRTTLREIKGSFSRYIAILSIIALGVGFFSGLKVTRPTMVKIVNEYVTEHALFDYRVLCSLGFESEDVEAFLRIEEVRAAEGSVFSDVLYRYGEDSSSKVASVHSLTEQINTPALKAGRMPEAANECVVDSNAFSEAAIGQQIIISEDNKEDTKELMTYDAYTIVGVVSSPAYLNFERGSSSIGNGIVSCFIYIPEEGFTFDYYSEIFIKLNEDRTIYSDTYENYIETYEDEVEEILKAQTDRRQQAVVSDAQTQIDEAQEEFDTATAQAWEELCDAQEKIQSAQEEIDTAGEALAEQESTLEDAITQLTDGLSRLTEALDQLTDGSSRLAEGLLQAQAGLLEVQSGIAQYDTYLAAYEGMTAAGIPLESLPQEEYERYLTLAAGKAALAEQETQLTETISSLEAQKAELEIQKTELETQKEALSGQLSQAQEGLTQIADAYAELSQAQETLDENMAEYEEGLAEYQKQAADGQEEIEDARTKLDEMEDAEYYLLGRNTNVGYVCFESDSGIVEGIADVFPVFFFLVAALVCITTMNRMVEEQRTQIGVLKALGYSRYTIMGKYMIYSGSAAMIGCIIGFLGGCYIFPNVIWKVYGIMYSVGGSGYILDLPLALISIIVSLLCSIGTTWLSCKTMLGSVAAQLIRPKAPRNGKRILLERITFIWKHLKFLHKVSIRNIFRYKKRFFMMVIGISGCMALVLTGLGIHDSIADVVSEQYDNIQTYDISVTLREAPDQAMRDAFQEEMEPVLEESVYYMTTTVDVTYQGRMKSINLIVPQDEQALSGFLHLFDEDGNEIPYPGGNEAVLSQKMAKKLKIRVGDTVTFRDSDMNEFTVTVTGICSNYVYNYIYISQDTYIGQKGKAPEYKSMWCNIREQADAHEAGTLIMENDNVASVSITADMVDRIDAMMSSLNYVIVLVIGCAAALAFIVLYNLTNINITERIREIATIKVLGFYPGETASYVFRENLVLTGIGAVVGIPLGVWLHRFVMDKIDIDAVSFQIKILPVSYIGGILLTFVFAMVVNAVMYFKLQKINMAESLKSIE